MLNLPARSTARYGWRPDLPDARDLLYQPETTSLPSSVDLEPDCPPVYDQGQLGSCTANAVAALIQFDRRQQGLDPDYVPSRLFIYWIERAIEGTIDIDAGATVRDSIKAVARVGAPAEEQWPYDVARFRDQPPHDAFVAAELDKALEYRRISQDLDHMRACLVARRPFVFGCSVYQSFEGSEVASTGTVPMPQPGEALLAGHAMAAVGYDDQAQRFKVRNSWGVAWGLRGYCWMPYAYLTDERLAADFWTIRLMSRLAE